MATLPTVSRMIVIQAVAHRERTPSSAASDAATTGIPGGVKGIRTSAIAPPSRALANIERSRISSASSAR